MKNTTRFLLASCAVLACSLCASLLASDPPAAKIDGPLKVTLKARDKNGKEIDLEKYRRNGPDLESPPAALLPQEPPAAVVESGSKDNGIAVSPLDACVSVWQSKPDASGQTHGGSGVCVGRDGDKSIILTNNHVVSPGKGADGRFMVTYPRDVVVVHAGRRYNGIAVNGDGAIDVAVIEVNALLPFAPLAEENATPGTTVTRNGIGSGFKIGTVAVHDPKYVEAGMHFWATSPSISGDSGSAYFNAAGEVVAIHNGRTPNFSHATGAPVTPIRTWLKKKFGDKFPSTDGPPAAKVTPKVQPKAKGNGLCVCGDGCACKAGECPGKCPATSAKQTPAKQPSNLPAHLVINGKLHERRPDGYYWPVNGGVTSQAPAAQPSASSGGCPGGVCPAPSTRRRW